MSKTVNESLLRSTANRLEKVDRFEKVVLFPVDYPESVIVETDLVYYPEDVDRAFLDIRTYLNGDFHISYIEERELDRWRCRWDRHENNHNSRDHFHPPPDAPTQGEDREYPDDFFDVLGIVLEYVESRLGEVW
ncbi:hypothetical protein ACEU6E_09755 [Halorutilales archaeon Cl-col2-1]